MKRRKIYELEADRFSGSVLRMLGATLLQAQAGVESIELEGETNTHPAKPARREAIATGWKKRDEFLRARVEGNISIPDRDGDGVADTRDQCPTEYGTHSSGCPDSDEDGIPDKDDNCPYDKGTAANHGCPTTAASTDRDGDGVPDVGDQCPDKKGEKRYAGCPDTDKDGIPDNKDKCINEQGSASNEGCPLNGLCDNLKVEITQLEERIRNSTTLAYCSTCNSSNVKITEDFGVSFEQHLRETKSKAVSPPNGEGESPLADDYNRLISIRDDYEKCLAKKSTKD